jgi:hypothetical protein
MILHSAMEKVLKVTATILAFVFCWIAYASAEEINLGKDSEGTSYLIDTKTIGKHVYPTGAGGNLVGVLTPKEYRETWANKINDQGERIEQYLWVFDCHSRAGTLAISNSRDASKSSDVTAQAQSIGVERYMQRIPPNSWYDFAEKIVCKRNLPGE